MSLMGKIQTLFSDEEKTSPVFPRTKVSAVSDDNGVGLDALLDEFPATNIKMANGLTLEQASVGCWIAFQDEDGNPTTEPYFHWVANNDGTPIITGLSRAEEGEF